jgi:hypothetical protein
MRDEKSSLEAYTSNRMLKGELSPLTMLAELDAKKNAYIGRCRICQGPVSIPIDASAGDIVTCQDCGAKYKVEFVPYLSFKRKIGNHTFKIFCKIFLLFAIFD